MRIEFEKFRVLIFALSILMSFWLAYHQYDNLGEIHFFPFNLTLKNFSNVDQEDFVMDPPDQSRGIVSASLVNLSHLGNYPFQDSFAFPLQSFSFEQKSSILRC